MIVKRVTEALQRQDWAVVSIEFVLVVVGVLFAFQINEFATERESAKEREGATERLLVEAEESVAYMRQTVDFQQGLVADLNFTLIRVQSGQGRPEEKKRMVVGLSRARTATPLAPPSSVYDDLVASGTFGRIGDPALRSKIARYRSSLLYSAQVREKLTRDMPRLEEYPALHYVFTPEGRHRIRLEVDFPALRKDSLLQEKLAMLADDQRVFLVNRRRILKDLQLMCVALGQFVGRDCNMDLPLPTYE